MFLNSDVVYNVCRYLEPDDIFYLLLANKEMRELLIGAEFVQVMYKKKFGLSSNAISSNYIELWKLRTDPRAQMYTWGSNDGGRLGYLLSKANPANVEGRSIVLPNNLSNFNDVLILDLKSNGFSFQILTNEGVFYTGSYNQKKRIAPGPKGRDYEPPLPGVANIIRGRISGGSVAPSPRFQHRQPTNPALRSPLADEPLNYNGLESDFVTKCKLPPGVKTIKAISSGRTNFIGLDDQNQIIVWDEGDRGVLLRFGEYGHIETVKSGWNMSGFKTRNELLIWYSRESIKEETYKSRECNAYYFRIKGQVVDFHLGNNFILLLTPTKLLYYKVDANHFHSYESGETLINMSEFQEASYFGAYLASLNAKGTNHKFTKLAGNFNSFAVFISDGHIVTSKFEDLKPQKVDLKNVIDLEMGDYHFLALDANGDCYSWGIESLKCGCLGLKDKEVAGTGYRVSKPQKIQVDGRWTVVTANGWHSGGILLRDAQ